MSETLTHLPVHLAIIMDGNGRWAQARGLPREAGHRAGAETVRTIVTECRRLGIRHLTLYTFSSENWSRPKTEVSALFSLLLEFLGQEVPRMEREGIRLNILGDMEALPRPPVRPCATACAARRPIRTWCSTWPSTTAAAPSLCAPCAA